MQTAVRVFDALLFEGSKILHRVALSMFKLTEPRLLQASDTMAAALSLRSAALRMHDRDLIMRTAVRRVGPLSQATIDKLRKSQQPDGVLSSLLSRMTATRKPSKAVPWQLVWLICPFLKRLVIFGCQRTPVRALEDAATEQLSASDLSLNMGCSAEICMHAWVVATAGQWRDWGL